VSSLLEKAREAGLREFGLTDHLHCPLNVAALEASRREFDSLDPPEFFHFGVEVSCLRKYDRVRNEKAGADGVIDGRHPGGPLSGPDAEPVVYFPESLYRDLRVEYAVGAAHLHLAGGGSFDKAIRLYHRQHLFLAAHPLVNILGHPWWWDAWAHKQSDFARIPSSMHRELAAALVETGTLLEVNLGAMLLNPHYAPGFIPKYLDYLALMHESGVRFSVGSDSHGPDGMAACIARGAEFLMQTWMTPDMFVSPIG